MGHRYRHSAFEGVGKTDETRGGFFSPGGLVEIAPATHFLYHARGAGRARAGHRKPAMAEPLTLTQAHLYTFQTCPRRFYLRYLARVPWPEAPLGAEQELAYERGRRLHRWIERHFLGLPAADENQTDPILRVWWDTFRRQPPALPPGRRFVEVGLTVPIGNHFLTDRFDLLVVSDDSGQPSAAHLFDWKTGDPRPVDRLRAAWQTRVYLAVLAEGGAALAPDAATAFAPDRLSFTYWYVADPEQPRVIRYDAAAHRRNWAELRAIVERMDGLLSEGEAAWPLTDDLAVCRACAYQALTGRLAAGLAEPEAPDEDEPPPDDWLEPQWG